MKMNHLINKNSVGALVGFIVGWFLIVYGLLNTVIVLLCVILGAILPLISVNDFRKKLLNILKPKEERD